MTTLEAKRAYTVLMMTQNQGKHYSKYRLCTWLRLREFAATCCGPKAYLDEFSSTYWSSRKQVHKRSPNISAVAFGFLSNGEEVRLQDRETDTYARTEYFG